MTDEEMAEKYRKSLKQKLIDEDEFERLEMFDENVEEAYLAGLKAGRSKCMYTGKEKIMKFYTLYLLFVLTKNKKEYILYS